VARSLSRRGNRQPVMVFAGNFRAGSTERGLSQGFQRLGWIVQEVDHRTYVGVSGGSPIARVVARLAKSTGVRNYNMAILDTCRHLQPDVFFTVKGLGLTQQCLSTLGAQNTNTVCYYPDLHFDHPNLDIGALYASDLFATSKSFHMPHLARQGLGERSCFVAHGYCENAHRPVLHQVSETDYTADVRYIGNHSPAKQLWLEELHGHAPELDLRVVGSRWRQALPPELRRKLFEAASYTAVAYALATQTARINVAVHWGKSSSGWEDLVSTRTFEIPACGGFMLHVDNDEIREYYRPGEEIDVFSSSAELADKCRYYLKHPEKRHRMAQKAHERCVPHYSYAARAAELDRQMKERFV